MRQTHFGIHILLSAISLFSSHYCYPSRTRRVSSLWHMLQCVHADKYASKLSAKAGEMQMQWISGKGGKLDDELHAKTKQKTCLPRWHCPLVVTLPGHKSSFVGIAPVLLSFLLSLLLLFSSLLPFSLSLFSIHSPQDAGSSMSVTHDSSKVKTAGS